MTKCGSVGSEADINTWRDTHDTGLPCARPLHPHVFHTHFPIPPFFLVSSKHRCDRRGFLEREGNVRSERSCCMLSLAMPNWLCTGHVFAAPRFARASCGEGSRTTASGGYSTDCWQGCPRAAGQSHTWEIGSLESPRPQRAPLPAPTLLLSSGVDNRSW